jgi:uroporphyrinogen-III synthase
VLKNSLKTEHGYRPSADHLVLILTDGRSQDRADEDVVKLHEKGVHVIILPMGKFADKEQINRLLPSADEVVETKAWTGLEEKLDALEVEKNKNCPDVQHVQARK